MLLRVIGGEVTMAQASISELQKAFAVATKAAQNDNTPQRERAYFRAIAFLIWKSCGTVDPFLRRR